MRIDITNNVGDRAYQIRTNCENEGWHHAESRIEKLYDTNFNKTVFYVVEGLTTEQEMLYLLKYGHDE